MVEHFKTQFPVNPKNSLSDLLEVCKTWVDGNRYCPLDKSALSELGEHGSCVRSDGYKCEVAHFPHGEQGLLGFKFTSPGDNSSEEWVSEIVGCKDEKDYRVSVTLDYHTLLPGQRPSFVRVPVISKLILNELGGHFDGSALAVRESPYRVNPDNAKFVAEILNGETGNTMPVMYLSKGRDNLQHICDSSLIAKRLCGVGHVLAEEVPETNYVLRKFLKGKSAYDGAVGIYWPFNVDRDLFRPGFFVSNTKKEISDFLEKRVIDGLKNQIFSEELTWNGIWSIHNQRRIQEMESSSRANEDVLLGIYTDELQRKQDENDKLRQRVSHLEATLSGIHLSKKDSSGIFDLINEIYPGEATDLLRFQLERDLDGSEKLTRRYHVFSKILEALPAESGRRQEYLGTLKKLLESYGGMTPLMKRELEAMGFTIEDKGKHCVIRRACQPEIITSLAKTPSDVRGGKNAFSNFRKKFF